MIPKSRNEKYDIIIIGAGAAGLMAGVLLCDTGKRVLVLEKKKQAGLKLRITGKGRCNLTNTLPIEEFIPHCLNAERISPNAETILRNAISFFSNADTVRLFRRLGLATVEERGRRVYPASGKSLDVFLSLVNRIERSGNVRLVCSCGVEELVVENGRIEGVVCQNGKKIRADKVLVCCGGESYPTTGSNGDGIRLAAQSGHAITPTMPALVGLRTRRGHPERLQGYTIRNVEVRILDTKDRVLEKEFGDVDLDEYGLAGSVILRLSRRIIERLYVGERLKAAVDMKPKVSREKLKREIEARFQERMGQTRESVLRSWLSAPLVEDCKCWLKRRKEEYAALGVRKESSELVLEYLKDNKDEIVGDMGFWEAVVTRGGVDLAEVDAQTLESKRVKGLYFAGEVLDLDGDTGGFNLQIAFSTAALACGNM